jgi:ankyrin repeat protein
MVSCGVVVCVAMGDMEINAREGVKLRSALHLAASNGHGLCVALLISARADVKLQDRAGLTALHLAAAHQNERALPAMLWSQDRERERDEKEHKSEAGTTISADIQWALAEARTLRGETPLHFAAVNARVANVRVLLKAWKVLFCSLCFDFVM